MIETIGEKVNRYLTEEAADTNMLDPQQVLSLALAAARKYSAYGEFAVHRMQREEYVKLLAQDCRLAPPDPILINQEIPVTAGEWAIISDLWGLYLERAQCKQLEASRGLGVEVFGRSSSEIEADIRAEHEALPMRAFWFGPVTI